MTVEEIERLLAEFYEGNTNEQEEELSLIHISEPTRH